VLLRLGSHHPIADELRSLGLPRPAVFSATVEHATMAFGDGQELVGGVRTSPGAAAVLA
jgi:hypothetical protein